MTLNTQDTEQRLKKAMAAIVKLEAQLDAAKQQIARQSGAYDLVRIADKDQTFDSIFYPAGSAELDARVKPFLDTIGQMLRSAPRVCVRIEGHADRDEAGEGFKELSKERSRRIYKYMLSQGVRPIQLKWCGYGDLLYHFDRTTDWGMSLNRRVELWPIMQWFLEPDETPKEQQHDFRRYVNPWIGSILTRTNLAKRITSARGMVLGEAHNGRSYYDFVAGCGAIPFGHNPPEIWEAIDRVREEAGPQVVFPAMMEAAGELAKRLVEIAPAGLNMAWFSNSGAEAIEAAIKLVRSKTGRPGILTAWNGFHGKTLGALSSSGNPCYQAGYYAPAPSFDKVPYGDARALDEALTAAPHRYAAFMVEPIQGPAGIVEASDEYLREVREVCNKHNVLLIFDEIATGLGRTGSMFGCEKSGVVPDVMTLAKALTGGIVPIGATLYKESVYNDLFARTHSSTFAMNALACNVGVASIDILTRDDRAIVRNAADVGAYLRSALVDLQKQYPKVIKAIRGRGLMLGIKFTDDKNYWGGNRLMGDLADHGQLAPMIASWLHNVGEVRVMITLFSSDVIRLTPSLNVTREQCDILIDAFRRVLPIVDSGDIARLVLEGHGEEMPADYVMPNEPPEDWSAPPQPGDRFFAFIGHLADMESYRDNDTSLRPLSDEVLDRFSKYARLDPTPVEHFQTRVRSKTGATAHGTWVTIPYTAEELKAMPRQRSIELIAKALDLAREQEVSIVGLGGYSSILSAGGIDLLPFGVNLTSGNAYTVVAGYQAVCAAMARLQRDLDTTIVVVGASGSIGRAISMLLGEVAGRLVLVGHPNRDPEACRKRLLEVAIATCRHVAHSTLENPGHIARRLAEMDCPAADAPDEAWAPIAAQLIELTQDLDGVLPDAEVVVTATSHPGSLINVPNVREGAVICDVAVPSNVSKAILTQRPDVLVIDGGIISVPGPVHIRGTKLKQGLSYSCMAETMLLCLDGREAEGSTGPDIPVESLHLVRELAVKHGFELANLRSFGEPLAEERWERLKARAPARASA